MDSGVYGHPGLYVYLVRLFLQSSVISQADSSLPLMDAFYGTLLKSFVCPARQMLVSNGDGTHALPPTGQLAWF